MKKRRVVIGVLGTVLDKRGKRANRFKKWRPTVGLCQQADFPVDRLELLHQPRDENMAQKLIDDVAQLSPHTEVRPHTIEINDPWDFEEVYAAFLDFANRYRFDTENEEYLVHITTGTHVAQICWFLLTEARYLPASLLQTSPAPKGAADDAVAAGIYSVIDLDLSRYAALTSRFQREQQQSVSFLKAGIETRNATFNALIDRIERVAIRSTDPILLTGPTGAGKSVLAKRIFQLRQSRHRVAGKFMAVNCATLRGDNAMSTLFGHIKGAFTGAVTPRAGLLREADGGVLFLDEIAELGLDEQAMLLKAIEEKTFFPFGSDKEVHSDFQLIAGTHRDMQQWVAEGRFREDLYARINMWRFALPAWRSGGKILRRTWSMNYGDWPTSGRRRSASIKTPANAIWPLPAAAGAMARQFPRARLLRGAYGDPGRAGAHYAGRCGRGDNAAERELAAHDIFS